QHQWWHAVGQHRDGDDRVGADDDRHLHQRADYGDYGDAGSLQADRVHRPARWHWWHRWHRWHRWPDQHLHLHDLASRHDPGYHGTVWNHHLGLCAGRVDSRWDGDDHRKRA